MTVVDFVKKTDLGIGSQIEWARGLLALTGVLIVWVAIYVGRTVRQIQVKIDTIDATNTGIKESISKIAATLKDLEARHNIIQSGTEYGRVLALRNFSNQGLTPQGRYAASLGSHCVVSTLILERAEELLTSEEYVRFLVGLKLPEAGYFRLVLAHKPKYWDGLSAYGIISQGLKYKTAILSMTCWQDVLRPALKKKLPQETFDGVVQLVERNTELNVENAGLDTLAGVHLGETRYAGRIGKTEKEKKEFLGTAIWDFASWDLSKMNGISPHAIEAYCRLLAMLSQSYVMDAFSEANLESLFKGIFEGRNIDHDLTSRIDALFGPQA